MCGHCVGVTVEIAETDISSPGQINPKQSLWLDMTRGKSENKTLCYLGELTLQDSNVKGQAWQYFIIFLIVIKNIKKTRPFPCCLVLLSPKAQWFLLRT